MGIETLEEMLEKAHVCHRLGLISDRQHITQHQASETTIYIKP